MRRQRLIASSGLMRQAACCVLGGLQRQAVNLLRLRGRVIPPHPLPRALNFSHSLTPSSPPIPRPRPQPPPPPPLSGAAGPRRRALSQPLRRRPGPRRRPLPRGPRTHRHARAHARARAGERRARSFRCREEHREFGLTARARQRSPSPLSDPSIPRLTVSDTSPVTACSADPCRAGGGAAPP